MTELLNLVDAHYKGLETGDLELALSPFADDVEAEFPSGPLKGKNELSGMVQGFITAFPGMKITRRNTWQDGSTVVVELTFEGRQDGPLATPAGDVPPSGRDVAFGLIDTFTQRDGKVVSHRVYWDNVAFLTQLGLLEQE